jgi:threonylcarbamoyladenosine tRNA methylthiotransferase MtaB
MNQYKKAAYYTLGCKLNFAETSSIARELEESGFARVEFNETPDVYVINTCSVTDHADKKCRNIVRKALRYNPNAFIVVIGCYAQLKPEEIASIEGVDLVLGANEKFKVADYLESLDKKDKGEIKANHIKETKDFVSSYSFGDRTRSFLKVQDGCDYFCSFCTIPLARGRSRNDTIQNTVAKAKEIASTEVKEVVLTGVNIGDFGKTTGERLIDLVKALDEVEGIERYRISSIEPDLLSDEIIDFVASSKRFAPHFHIPLQSGSDKILSAMRRRYESSLYKRRVERIKEKMPYCCIGVDVIVGFPGETEEEFLTTYNFLNELNVSYFHVFTYSERENTTALRIEDVVPFEVRQKRNRMLQILSEKKKRAFYQENQHKTVKVLFEQEEQEGYLYGFSENYVKVKAPYAPELINQLLEVNLNDLDRDGVYKCVSPLLVN